MKQIELTDKMDFNAIKLTAKERGCRVADFIALAQQNDPFYIGTKSQLDLAHWFKDVWVNFRYDQGVHLRRIHYRIISQDKDTEPDAFDN